MIKIVDFSSFSSIKIGAIKDLFIIEEIKEYKEYFIIGASSNSIITQSDKKLAMLSKKYNYIKIEDNILRVGGATPSGKLHSFCKKHNIANFEYLSKLPGKMGGLVKMNAGMKEYEISNYLKFITTYKGKILKNNLDFRYRDSGITDIIYEVAFDLEYGYSQSKVDIFTKMRANQPKEPSCGSAFKNPENDSAGRLIEAVGLKGKRVGGMGWSNIHANFLVNYGSGKIEDALSLIEEAKQKVLEEFNIELELEINII